MIRVLIADDQDMVRSNLRALLTTRADMRVVGEAADGTDAIDLARRLRPDVVITDVRMPRVDGIEVTRALAGADAAAPIPVVVLTTFDLDEYVHAALREGASGFLLKRSGPTLLVEAIRAAVAGDALISPSITLRLLAHLAPHRPSAPQSMPGPHELVEPLTTRERDIARLVAQGLTNTEIGAELFITAGTAKTHVANIQRKLGVRNRVGIALWAKDNQLI